MTKGWRCKGCHAYQSRPSPAWTRCTRTNMLCHRVDPALLDRYPGKRTEWYQEAGRQIQAGYAVAREWLGQNGECPTADDFRTALIEAHRIVFADAEPDIAGRFRNDGERVTVGGPSTNTRFDGVAAHRIEAELGRFYNALRPFDGVPADRDPFAHWCARFLERFFRIHPFVDGNGRIARLFLMKAAESRTRFRFIADFPQTRKDRLSYVKRLEYAHRHSDDAHPLRVPGVDSLAHLARWLGRHLETLPLDWEDVGEPPPASGD